MMLSGIILTVKSGFGAFIILGSVPRSGIVIGLLIGSTSHGIYNLY